MWVTTLNIVFYVIVVTISNYTSYEKHYKYCHLNLTFEFVQMLIIETKFGIFCIVTFMSRNVVMDE